MTHQILNALGGLVGFAQQALVVAVCILLYRRVRLPSLPWLAAHFAIIHLSGPFTGDMAKPVADFIHHAPNPSVALAYWNSGALVVSIICSVIGFLVTLLILSEIVYFVSTHTQIAPSRVLSCVAAARAHAKLLGLILVILTLVTQAFMCMPHFGML